MRCFNRFVLFFGHGWGVKNASGSAWLQKFQLLNTKKRKTNNFNMVKWDVRLLDFVASSMPSISITINKNRCDFLSPQIIFRMNCFRWLHVQGKRMNHKTENSIWCVCNGDTISHISKQLSAQCSMAGMCHTQCVQTHSNYYGKWSTTQYAMSLWMKTAE